MAKTKDVYEQITGSLRDLTAKDIYGDEVVIPDEISFDECMESGNLDDIGDAVKGMRQRLFR